MKKILLLFCLLLMSLSVFAQDESTPLHLQKERLDETDLLQNTLNKETRLVSVSRSEKELKDIPSTVYVITREEILENGFVTLVDVLKTVPWIKVSQPGSGRLGEMFLMRGQIGNTYTKILVNNVPIQPIVNGELPIGAQLPISQAERIEIVYGPTSAVYGADAVAGVINIITQTSQKSAYAQANGYFGTNNFRHLDFLAGGKAGRDRNVLQYSIYGNVTKRDDLNIDRNSEVFNTFESLFSGLDNADLKEYLRTLAINHPDSFIQTIIRGDLPFFLGNDIFHAQINELPEFSYLIGVKFNFRKWQISLDEMYRQTHSSIGKQTHLFSYAKPDTYIGETIRRTHVSYQSEKQKSSFLFNFQVLTYAMDNNSSLAVNYDGISDNGRAYQYEASTDIFAEAIYTRKVNTKFELTMGTSTSVAGVLPGTNDLAVPFDESLYDGVLGGLTNKDSIRLHPILGSFGFNPQIVANVGGFVQGYYTTEKWVGVVGGRVDFNSIFGSAAMPRVGFLYKLSPKLAIRTSYAGAFRAPSLSTVYASVARPVTINGMDSISYEQVPNTNLKPETSITGELGLRYFPYEKFTFDGVLFVSAVRSPIVSRFVSLDRTQYPLAYYLSGDGNYTARSFVNDEKSGSVSIGLQTMLKIKDIIPRFHVDTDLFLSYVRGGEILPNDGGEIDAYRMQPNFMAQWRLSFKPTEKWYINFQNVWMSSWYRRNISTLEEYQQDNAHIEGYYTLDMLIRHHFNKNVSAYFRMNNVFNRKYAGIGAEGIDVDLLYNPQLLTNIQTGLTFRIN